MYVPVELLYVAFNTIRNMKHNDVILLNSNDLFMLHQLHRMFMCKISINIMFYIVLRIKYIYICVPCL